MVPRPIAAVPCGIGEYGHRFLAPFTFLQDVEWAPHPGVVERRHLVVEVQERQRQREPFQNLEIAVLLQRIDAVQPDVVDQVHLASAQAGQAHPRLGDLAVGNAVHVGRSLPVVVKADQLDLVAEFPADELERPGADRVRAMGFAAALGPQRVEPSPAACSQD